jgi:hypothetical protein
MQRQSLSRLTIERLSTNPIGAIIGSIQTAVDNVHSKEHGRKLNHIISRSGCLSARREATHLQCIGAQRICLHSLKPHACDASLGNSICTL